MNLKISKGTSGEWSKGEGKDKGMKQGLMKRKRGKI